LLSASFPGLGCPGGAKSARVLKNYFFFLAFAFLAFFAVLAFFAFLAIASSYVGWMNTQQEAGSAEGQLCISLNSDPNRFAALSSRRHAAVMALSTAVAC
jgi:hypothetical protein